MSSSMARRRRGGSAGRLVVARGVLRSIAAGEAGSGEGRFSFLIADWSEVGGEHGVSRDYTVW